MRACYPLVVFDLDGTLVQHQVPIWKTLHGRLGSDPVQRSRVIADARTGALSYAEWFAADLRMLQAAGANERTVRAVLSELHAAPGAAALVSDLREAGARVAVLSGGVDTVLQVALAGVTFDAVWVNQLRFDDTGALVGGTPTPYDQHRKVDGLIELAGRFGVALAQTAFIGDGPNDVDAARSAGLSVAWGSNPDPALRYVAHHHVPGPDMADLRPLLLR